MNIQMQNRAGFTLIELIAVMVLSGIGLIFVGMLVVTSTESFISSKNAAEDSQKIQIAMNRLVKELTFAGVGTVIVSNEHTIEWTSRHPDRLGETASATWDGISGSSLEYSTSSLNRTDLLDRVGNFTVSSTTDSITIKVVSSRSVGVEHIVTFHPRYEL